MGDVKYFCVSASPGDGAVCTEFDTRDELTAHLRDTYTRAVETADPDIRVFVFAGRRLQVSGAAERVVTFEDGTRAVISAAREDAGGDLLLALADRLRAG